MPLSRLVLLLCLLTLPFTAPAQARETAPTASDQITYDINTVEPGGLYFATETAGRVVRSPTLKADVIVTINGPVVHTRVTQHFLNKGNAWVEGLYTYPLPKGSAIDRLEMQVGDRIIIGDIQEKQQAQRTFDEAKREGKRASLVIQRRPNIFTTKLANIGPGETIKVSIEYQDLIEPRDNQFELRFPMVVRPRYVPGIPLDTTVASAGWSFDTDQVPDGASIAQPYLPVGMGADNPVNLTVSINAGFTLKDIISPSHEVDVAKSEKSARVTLKDGAVPADQDFILRWTPAPNRAPQVGRFTETSAAGSHQLLMVMPPVTPKADDTPEADTPGASIPAKAQKKPAARELIIVLDRSGSMGGQAITQAKAAVRRAVMRLKTGDVFNIIVFDNNAQTLFPDSTPVTERSIYRALDFIDSVQAGGGTEMSSALKLALVGGHTEPAKDTYLSETSPSHGQMKQVIFITDGAVGNEADLMDQIKNTLGNARLFTVGIGSAPNSYFMSEAAIWGRGTYINIAMNDDVLDAMNRLFQKIERPQITNIQISGTDAGHDMDMVPASLPDLYDGEPVIILMKTADTSRQGMTLTGNRDGSEWATSIPGAKDGEAKGIANLWARRKIDSINRSYVGGARQNQNDRRSEVLALALGYHLVSEFTSLVAVEKEPTRPLDATLYKRETPANLPAGMAAGRASNQLQRLTFAHGAQKVALTEEALMVRPRATATPMMLYLMMGMLLVATSVALWLMAHRRLHLR